MQVNKWSIILWSLNCKYIQFRIARSLKNYRQNIFSLFSFKYLTVLHKSLLPLFTGFLCSKILQKHSEAQSHQLLNPKIKSLLEMSPFLIRVSPTSPMLWGDSVSPISSLITTGTWRKYRCGNCDEGGTSCKGHRFFPSTLQGETGDAPGEGKHGPHRDR